MQSLGLANARDLIKLIHWNEKYGIKFLRISSEIFPFASHAKYGYDLDFAKDVLAEAGAVAMKHGHRLTTHPGQFTQFGSPRKEVVEASVRDIEYHCQLMRFLGLKGQTDRDAVLILHMGGAFGDKEATLQRFRENYKNLLSDEAKRRLVLENDDVCWNVHELLPICKELNIPMVLDWHHHNLLHDPSLREGSLDILPFMDEIKQTWVRKGITQKQHYSEPRDDAITNRDRRRHSARVRTLPPCDDTMDLMIEAKDKEQAVFEVVRKFKIDGWEKISDMVPHVREDENKPEPKGKIAQSKAKKKRKKDVSEDTTAENEEAAQQPKPEMVVPKVPEEEIGMGGTEGRVYWPEGMEAWLCPPKRVRKVFELQGSPVVDWEERPETCKSEEKPKVNKGKEKTATAVGDEDEAAVAKAQEIERDTAPPPKRARTRKNATAEVDEEIAAPPPKKKSGPKKKKTAIEEETPVSEIPQATPAQLSLSPPKKRSRSTKKAQADLTLDTTLLQPRRGRKEVQPLSQSMK